MKLEEFLEARIAEDEATASKASSIGDRWCVSFRYGEPQDIMAEGQSGEPESGMYVTIDAEGLMPSVDADAAYHIARYDPARVLAECAAKHAVMQAVNDSSYGGYEAVLAGEVILYALAAPHSAHPDFNPDWAVA